MVEVRWTPEAAGDLESITNFIAKDSPYYARLFVIDVLEAVDRLLNFPKSGRVVPGVKKPGYPRNYFRQLPACLSTAKAGC